MTLARTVIRLFLTVSTLSGSVASSQFSYVPGTKLAILRADAPLPEHPAVETELAKFAKGNGFVAGAPMGPSNVSYGRDPNLSLVGTFAPAYVTVVLWTDPEDHDPHEQEASDLKAALTPLGFRQVAELPVDPD